MNTVLQVPELLKIIFNHLLRSDYTHNFFIRSDSRKDLYHASLVSRACRYPASELLWKHLESFRPFTKVLDSKGGNKSGQAAAISKLSARVQTISIKSKKSDKSEVELYLRLCEVFDSKPVFSNSRKVNWDYDDYAGPPHLLGIASPTLNLIRISTNTPSKGGRRKTDSTSVMVESVLERCPFIEEIHIRDRIQGSVISLESLKHLKHLRCVKLDPGPSEIDHELISFLVGLPAMANLETYVLDHSWDMEITGGDSMSASHTVKLRTRLEKVEESIKRLPENVHSVVTICFETEGSEYLSEALWEKRYTEFGAVVRRRFAKSLQELEFKDQGPPAARLTALVDAMRGLHNVTKFTYGEWYRGGISMTLADLDRMGAIWPNLTSINLFGCDVSSIQRPASGGTSDLASTYGLDLLPLLARPFPSLRILKTNVSSALTPPPYDGGDNILEASSLEELTLCDRGASKREFWNLAASWSAVYYLIGTFQMLQKIFVDNDVLTRYHQGIRYARQLRLKSELRQESVQAQDLKKGMLIVVEDDADRQNLYFTIDETKLLEMVDKAPNSGMVLARFIRSGSCGWVTRERTKATVDHVTTVELAAEWHETFSKARQEAILTEWAAQIEDTLFIVPSKRVAQTPNLAEIDLIFRKLEQAQFTWKDNPATKMRTIIDRLCNAKLPSSAASKQFKWRVRAKELKEQWAYYF